MNALWEEKIFRSYKWRWAKNPSCPAFNVSKGTICHFAREAQSWFLNLPCLSPFISAYTNPQRISPFGPQSRVPLIVQSAVGKQESQRRARSDGDQPPTPAQPHRFCKPHENNQRKGNRLGGWNLSADSYVEEEKFLFSFKSEIQGRLFLTGRSYHCLDGWVFDPKFW